MFKKLAFRIAKGYILKKVDEGEFRIKIAKAISDKIDIPGVKEKQEYRLSLALVDCISDLIKGL